MAGMNKFAVLIGIAAGLILSSLSAQAASAVAASPDGAASSYAGVEKGKAAAAKEALKRCNSIARENGQRPCKVLETSDFNGVAYAFAVDYDRQLGTAAGFGRSKAEAEGDARSKCMKFRGVVECQIESFLATPFKYESRSPAAPHHGHYVSPHEAPMEHEKPMAHQAPMPHEEHLPHEAPRLYK